MNECLTSKLLDILHMAIFSPKSFILLTKKISSVSVLLFKNRDLKKGKGPS